MDESTIARFWSKVDKRGADECWRWRATLNPKGYGAFRMNARSYLAHRIAWQISNGRRPQQHVIHSCDVPACCNPRHLADASNAQNRADSRAKGRHAHGASHGSVTKPWATSRGEEHCHAKLTVKSIARALALRAEGRSYRAIGEMMGVRHGTIADALLGRSWRPAPLAVIPSERTRATPEERYWGRVARGQADECWLWTGLVSPSGYGVFWWHGHTGRAHRFGWSLAHGPIGPGLLVLHLCEARHADPISYRRCQNPAHMRLGTDRDNVDDRVAKGRTACGDRNGSRLHLATRPRGERHYSARLDDELVRHIRARARAGDQKAAIARDLQIGESTVWNVINRRTWKHV
jgi:hypothetical protein